MLSMDLDIEGLGYKKYIVWFFSKRIEVVKKSTQFFYLCVPFDAGSRVKWDTCVQVYINSYIYELIWNLLPDIVKTVKCLM